MKEMDPYNQSQSMGEAEEYGLLTQEDGERPNPWETKKSPEEEPERKDVPGWPKSWPKWLIWLFCAACFWFARNGMTLIKSYNEYQHWFDGVEEAGFHAETQHPDKEEPFVWIGRDGDDSYKKGEPDEDGYYWYKLSKRNSVYYPFEKMMDSSVMVRSKKPIQSAGRGMYIRVKTDHRFREILSAFV